jgi:LEA14-like dessication related protein
MLSCASLKDLATPQKPLVSFQGVHLDKISFQSVDLLFDLKIDNPNAFGVSLAGFDYEFFINQNRFLKGVQDEKQSIAANTSSTVQFPLGLDFADLYNTFNDLKNTDRTTYQINLGFSFDVPIIGVIKVPVSKAGTFPLLKLPKITMEGIKLKKLNLTGAELLLNLQLDNPNAFSATLNRLNYALSIGGQEVASGLTSQAIPVNQKASSQITIPVSLNFLQSGRTLYNILTSNKNFDYKITGDFDFSTSLQSLGNINVPFERSGKINLTR